MKVVKVVTSIPGLGGADSTVVIPEDYLSASGEALFLIIVMSWTIAYFFSYDNILNNPVKEMLGYNNACVAWDVAPALYPASFLFLVPTYFSVRFAILDLERAALRNLSSAHMCLVRVANMCYVLSFAGVAQIFVVTPAVDAKIHALLFGQFVFFRFVIIAGNCIWKERDLTFKNKLFLVVYGVISLLLLLGMGITLALHKQGDSPVVPPTLLMTVDYLWFLCLPLTAKFLPEAEAIRFHLTLEKKDGSQPVCVGKSQEVLDA